MAAQRPIDTSSGETSPKYQSSRFTPGSRMRRNSAITTITSISAQSSPSVNYPGAPINSPENVSLFGEVDDLDADNLADRLKQMPVEMASPHAQSGSKSAGTPTPTKLSKITSTTSNEVSEYSTWAYVAEEDVSIGLKRLAMLAKDEHKKDGRKTVEQYYSEHLARLIDEAELKFNCAVLH